MAKQILKQKKSVVDKDFERAYNSAVKEGKYTVYGRVSKSMGERFKLILMVNGETMQDAIEDFVMNYIKDHDELNRLIIEKAQTKIAMLKDIK